jgi:acyl carrier protein
METDVEKKLSQIFKIVFELPIETDISTFRRINEVHWDSLANVTLVTAIESEFGINLDYSDAERLTSYKSALILIFEKIG